MFANLKKKLEEGSSVSPVGTERKSAIANSAAKSQNVCHVHGEGFLKCFVCPNLKKNIYITNIVEQ